MTNAIITLIRPYAVPLATDTLQREHREAQETTLRCWMTRTSAAFEAHVLGGLTTSSWRCRFQTDLPVAAGWRARITLDRDNQEYEYEVKRTGNAYAPAVLLDLERVS